MSCEECPKNKSKCFQMKSMKKRNVIFVVDCPSASDFRSGALLTSDSGRMLKEAITKVGFELVDWDVAPLVRASIKDNKATKEVNTVIRECSPSLLKALKQCQPKLVVPVGAVAAKFFTKATKLDNVVNTLSFNEILNCQVFPIYSPEYVLANPIKQKAFTDGLAKCYALYENDFKDDVELEYEIVESIAPLLEGNMPKIENSYFVAIDTETQGIDWTDPNFVCISYSITESFNKGLQVFLYEECTKQEADKTILWDRGGESLTEVYVKKAPNYDKKIEELKEICRRQDVKKVFMNYKFDRHALSTIGVTELNNVVLDVALAAHVIDSELYLQPSLDTLIKAFAPQIKTHKDIVAKSEKQDMLASFKKDRERISKYAALDTVATLLVALGIRTRLLKSKKEAIYYAFLVHPVECELLYELECNGITVNTDKISTVKFQLLQKIEALENEVKELVPNAVKEVHGNNFKLTKRQVLVDALFKYKNKLGIETNIGFGVEPLELSEKTNLPSTDKDHFKKLALSNIPKKARLLIEKYEEWGKLEVLYTRYIKNIEKYLAPDKRLHPVYSTTYTSSGRTGARNPSIQNFPARGASSKYIKTLLEAPQGKSFIKVDYSMSELRWVAHVANEKTMQKIFNEGGDIHMKTGLHVARVADPSSLTKEQRAEIRTNAKACNFGLIYGMSARGYKEYSYTSYGVLLSDREAEEQRALFFDLYSGLPAWHDSRTRFIKQNGYIHQPLGRRRNLSNVFSKDYKVASKALRAGINFEIQNPSSDAALLGGYNFKQSKYYDKKEIELCGFIHDAFICICDENRLDYYCSILKYYLENVDLSKFGVKLNVPIVVDFEVGQCLDNLDKYTPPEWTPEKSEKEM